MCSKIGEFEGYCATEQVPACNQEPVDSIIVETSTCLETTQQETTNFTVQLLIESDRSMFSCAPECYSSYRYKYVLQIGEWGGVLGLSVALRAGSRASEAISCIPVPSCFGTRLAE